MLYKYLFFKENNKIMIFHYREDSFELIRYQGEDYYLGDLASFWEWWEKTSSFLASQHQVDFLFLTDDNNFNLKKEYSSVKESSWSLEELKEFLALYSPYSKIRLKQGESSSKLSIKFEKLADKYRDEVEAILYLITFPKKELLEQKNETIIEEIKGGELSPLAKFYREKNKKI